MRFDDYPKSIKKALRYIKQDASLDQLKALENTVKKTIESRKKSLQKREN